MKVTLIGDVHGKIWRYVNIVKRLGTEDPEARTIQVGDMGLGFPNVNLPIMKNHRFFRGNHDCPRLCWEHPNYLGDYGYDEATGIFWVAGAWSIDAKWRVPEVSWWENEELTDGELEKAIDLYSRVRPRIVISHECPTRANNALLRDLNGPYFAAKGECGTSRTCRALQAMLDMHQPEQWIFGHYHVNKPFQVPGYTTKFQCIAELSTYVLDIPKEKQ